MTTASKDPRPPLQPSTVLAEPATVQAAADDYAGRNTTTPQTITATPHTHGRKP
ncbi:hypothetical protein OG552_10620 [Streptomyces sp. NBC_01476]|uniref:hypothetical protein n=1 Tax=Streptomyces sp. NBC_01476 TaxID=2903881 RepID=UPI002E352FCE|nr:hypothetical protein [Streptomyces sp. NBC_01476]